MSETQVIRSIDELIDCLGGREAVGRLLGIGGNGVSMWKVRGEIPRGFHLDLFLECGRLGFVIDPKLLDLKSNAFAHVVFVPKPPRPSRSRRAG